MQLRKQEKEGLTKPGTVHQFTIGITMVEAEITVDPIT
jgi:hypothetical protein